MLLPSALPCDTRPHTHHLLTSPPPHSDSSALTTGLYTTCRALHSLLNATSSPLSPPQRTYKRPLQSPIPPVRRTPTTPGANPPPRPPPPPRGPNKRRRDPLDNTGAVSDRDPHPRPDPYTTPKRPRLPPPSLPLGLSPSDFASLSLPPPRTTPVDSNTPTPASSSTTTPDSDWTPSSDHALVAFVLSRIKLSRGEWNECARRLGRGGDGDGVGERWGVLVGEGRVGLRGEEVWT